MNIRKLQEGVQFKGETRFFIYTLFSYLCFFMFHLKEKVDFFSLKIL